jgi:hypothetical protein
MRHLIRIATLALTAPLAGCPLEEAWPEETTATVHGVWTGGAPPSRLDVVVEGEVLDARIAADGAFRVDGVPPGDHVVYVVAGQRRGRVDLDGLQPGERVYLRVEAEAKALDVDVDRRVHPDDLAPLRIDGNDVRHTLPAGVIESDVVVSGNDVRLFGHGCGRTVLYGRLLVSGNDVTVEGVDVRGPAHLQGNDVAVEDPCAP